MIKKVKLIIIVVLLFSLSGCKYIASNELPVSYNTTFPYQTPTLISETITSTPGNTGFFTNALSAYKSVLQNKAPMIQKDVEDGDNNTQNIYLNKFFEDMTYEDAIFSSFHFAVIDMDSDNMPEVIFDIIVGDDKNQQPYGYVVLHCYKNNIYGYLFPYRGLEDLKTDGTFCWADGASHWGYGRLIFIGDDCKTEDFTYYKAGEDNDGNPTYLYFVDTMPSTEYDFTISVDKQDAKKAVYWYDFTPENIEKYF